MTARFVVTTDRLVPGTNRPRTTIVANTSGRTGYHKAHQAAHDAGGRCVIHIVVAGRRVPIAICTPGGTERLPRIYDHLNKKHEPIVQEDTIMSNTATKNTTPAARIVVWGVKPSGKGGVRVLSKKEYDKPGSARNAAAKQSSKDGVTYVDLVITGVGEYRYEKGAVVRKDEKPTATATAPKSTVTKSAPKDAPKTTPTPAPRAPKAPTAAAPKLTSWAVVLEQTDGAISRAHKNGRKVLTIDADAVLKAAKSKDATDRYDRAYLRFLAGNAGSFPSNPKSTGIAAGSDRTARREAIRKAVAKVTGTTAAKAAA